MKIQARIDGSNGEIFVLPCRRSSGKPTNLSSRVPGAKGAQSHRAQSTRGTTIKFILTFAFLLTAVQAAIAQDSIGHNVAVVSENHVVCHQSESGTPSVYWFGPSAAFDQSASEEPDLSEIPRQAIHEIRETFREFNRHIATRLCDGATVEQINTQMLLPEYCLKIEDGGWMNLERRSDSVAENVFVSSALCHSIWTPEEINRDFLNPSGKQLTTDERGRPIIQRLPNSPDHQQE